MENTIMKAVYCRYNSKSGIGACISACAYFCDQQEAEEYAAKRTKKNKNKGIDGYEVIPVLMNTETKFYEVAQ